MEVQMVNPYRSPQISTVVTVPAEESQEMYAEVESILANGEDLWTGLSSRFRNDHAEALFRHAMRGDDPPPMQEEKLNRLDAAKAWYEEVRKMHAAVNELVAEVQSGKMILDELTPAIQHTFPGYAGELNRYAMLQLRSGCRCAAACISGERSMTYIEQDPGKRAGGDAPVLP